MLAVGNCCYVAVCSAVEGALAPTGGGDGRGHTVAAARLQLVGNGPGHPSQIIYYPDYQYQIIGCFAVNRSTCSAECPPVY